MNLASETRPASATRDPRVGAVAVTGWGVHVPDFDLATVIAGWASGPACPSERAHELLGRRGLLYKDASTRLALCAVHRALNLQPRAPRPDGAPDPRTAVVASSNLGNTATVHSIARKLQHGSIRDISPLEAPNASSNVVSSTVAIWFRFGGPNLMVCSGATSGLDA